MPNRIIRDAILTSQPVSSLDWPEEVFYRRLMSIVDDYGRCEAFPQLLRSRCYPLQTDKVRVADISRWLAACQKAGLLAVYAVADKEYLQVEKFGQQTRSPSKCPAPSSLASNCQQPIADAPVFVSVSVDEDVPPAAAPAGALLPEWMPGQEWSEFLIHRKAMRGVPFTDAARKGVIRDIDKLRALGHDPAVLLSTAITRGWRTVFEPKPERTNPADVARITVPGPKPSSFLAEQAAHLATVEAERLARRAQAA